MNCRKRRRRRRRRRRKICFQTYKYYNTYLTLFLFDSVIIVASEAYCRPD